MEDEVFLVQAKPFAPLDRDTLKENIRDEDKSDTPILVIKGKDIREVVEALGGDSSGICGTSPEFTVSLKEWEAEEERFEPVFDIKMVKARKYWKKIGKETISVELVVNYSAGKWEDWPKEITFIATQKEPIEI